MFTLPPCKRSLHLYQQVENARNVLHKIPTSALHFFRVSCLLANMKVGSPRQCKSLSDGFLKLGIGQVFGSWKSYKTCSSLWHWGKYLATSTMAVPPYPFTDKEEDGFGKTRSGHKDKA